MPDELLSVKVDECADCMCTCNHWLQWSEMLAANVDVLAKMRKRRFSPWILFYFFKLGSSTPAEQLDWIWAINSIWFHILSEYPSYGLSTLYSLLLFLPARLPSAPHRPFCTLFICSSWQASYLVTIDTPEPYRSEGQMRHRRKWWLFFICGLSRPPFHQVTVCTFGEAKCFYWTSAHSFALPMPLGSK